VGMIVGACWLVYWVILGVVYALVYLGVGIAFLFYATWQLIQRKRAKHSKPEPIKAAPGPRDWSPRD